MPEIRDNILRSNEGKWNKIAKKQMKTCFDPSSSDLKMQAKRYGIVNLLSFFFSKYLKFSVPKPDKILKVEE